MTTQKYWFRAASACLALLFSCAGPLGAQALNRIPEMSPRAQEIQKALELVETQAETNRGPVVMLELDGEVNEDTVGPLIAKMKELDAAGQPEIWLRLNSGGGSVSAGLDLMTEIESLKARTTCVADWRSMSMAFSILESCQTRLAVPQALMMMHAPSTEVSGNENKVRQDLEVLQALRSIMVSKLAKRIKLSREEIEHHMDTHAYYITADEALRIGAIDKVVEVKDLPPVTPLDPPKEQNLLQLLMK